MEDIPSYNGKPTVYLDQNILDMFVKYGLGSLGKGFAKDYQVVYSDETLKEIQRSVGYESQFLDVLKKLNAAHIKLVLEQPHFIDTNSVTITFRDPHEAYEEYCEHAEQWSDLEIAQHQWLLKFSGGRQGDTISDIHKEQLESFEKLMDSLKDNADVFPEELQEQLSFYADSMIEQYKETLQQSETQMLKSIADEKSWNGINEFREHVKLGPIQLNNIKSPNVLNQIWEMLKNSEHYCYLNMDIEDFFQTKANPIYPDRTYYNHQKVTSIYNMLNTLGYYPDSKIHKERRFVAAMSDTSHSSIASFCNYLISNDEAFIKKTAAAYEFLGIKTEAIHVIIEIKDKRQNKDLP